ncbi:MFS transporter [Streptodolium elevatio]|uniref:MFS transporter n=1 Tax=Streptodolium elevatio TaxID=3157996 RepID=A0ABV3DLW8_9ACTN
MAADPASDAALPTDISGINQGIDQDVDQGTHPKADRGGDPPTAPGTGPGAGPEHPDDPEGARAVRRARLGIAGTFALAGGLCAVWTVRVPALKDKLAVSDGQLGLIVLAFGIGGVLTMGLMGRLVARYGSRRLLRTAVPLCTLAVAAIGLSPNLPTVIAAGFAFGVVFGVTDVAMNTQASLLEQRYGRSLMAGMHAGWSLGAVTGGLLGALAAKADLGFTASVVTAAAVGVPVSLWLRVTYLPDAPPARGPAEEHAPGGPTGSSPDMSPGTSSGASCDKRTGRVRVTLPLVVYIAGAIAFCGYMIEGAVADWSGLYLRDTIGSAEAVAALAYPLFEAATALGRLTGDRITNRFGARAVLTASGLAAGIGLGLAVAARGTAAGLAGFFLVGLGACLIVPLAFSVGGALGGSEPATAGAAIARIGAMAYTGLLLGPVVIGFIADASTLRIGLSTTLVLAVAVALGARLLPGKRHLDAHPHPAEPAHSVGPAHPADAGKLPG